MDGSRGAGKKKTSWNTTGWVRIDRKLFEHWIWKDKPFARGQAWVDLILMVNHADGKTVLDGKKVSVKRGSKVTSLRQLSERWGWSPSKTRRFLNELENEKMLKVKCDTKKTVITLINYGKFQDRETGNETATRHRRDTDETQTNTNNNNKTIINNNKQITAAAGFALTGMEDVMTVPGGVRGQLTPSMLPGLDETPEERAERIRRLRE